MRVHEPKASDFATTAAEQDLRWAQVVARDRSADGAFWCSVTTTGIYCRPSCPSRRPHRENVRFYDTIAEAVAAGFRPCKRCKPDQFIPDDNATPASPNSLKVEQ